MTAVPDAPAHAVAHGERVLTSATAALDLPFAGDDLHLLRAAVAAHAGRLGGPGDRIGHLVAVASELAAYAIRHGGGTGRLRLWRDATSVLCQVTITVRASGTR